MATVSEFVASINAGFASVGAEVKSRLKADFSNVKSPATARTAIGLGSVNNTSDDDKPVSRAQASALAAKAPLHGPDFTGAPRLPFATMFKAEAGGAGEGGQFILERASDSSFAGNVVVDVYGGDIRIFESLAPNRGIRIPLASQGAGAGSVPWTSTNFNPADHAAATVATLAGDDGMAKVAGKLWTSPRPYKRTVLDRMRETGASVRDIIPSAGTGAADDEAFAEAFDLVAQGVRKIILPGLPQGSAYRLTRTLEIKRSCEIEGEGAVPYVGAIQANQPVTRGPGSWLHIDHSGEGLKFYGEGGQELSGGRVTGLGTIRNQPPPAAGWTPADNAFDFVFLSGDWYADDLMAWNPTRGILHDYAGYGRLDIGRVRMAPFRKGFQIDRCYDIFRAGNIHIWPFSGIHDSYRDFRYANLVGMEFRKVDHTMIDNYFAIGCKNAIELLRGAEGGVPTHIQFDKVQADLFGQFGLYIDGDADGASIEVANFYGQGAVAADGNPGGAQAGVVVNGDFCTVKAGIFQINRVNQQAAIVNGAGSRAFLGQPTVNEYNRGNLNATAFAVTGGGSSIHLGDKVAVSGGNGTAAQDTTGRISSHEWLDDTASPSATVGTISNGRANRHWNRHGDKVSINLDITITTNGDGRDAVWVDLPIPVRGGRVFFLHGQDYGLSGKALIGRCEGGRVLIYDYANAYPGANGARLFLTGFYEADPL